MEAVKRPYLVEPSASLLRGRICVRCGESFYDRQKSTIKQKYCSLACAGEAKRERAAKRYPPEDEILALYAAGKTDRDVGPMYGHSYMWALGVRKHYGIRGRERGSWARKPLHKKNDRGRWGIHLKPEDRCRNCGARGRLDLHHAIPRSICGKEAKYDLRNGLPLCDACHFGWHHKKLVIYRDVFTQDEWEYLSALRLTGRETISWLDMRYPRRGLAA